ncbi:MAG TPA: hypothetical protein VKR06_40580 [Ktedonosporobacter sp.]|nr:hypothetical protein [Ktedonosporobacter sp.]
MKKEDFPTFLNEQATVIFGRTVRELLWIVCAIVSSYQTWIFMQGHVPGAGGMALGIVLGGVVGIALLVIALLPVGGRALEEWVAVWLMYAVMPKLYLYKPAEEEIEFDSPASEREKALQQQPTSRVVDLDILEQD